LRTTAASKRFLALTGVFSDQSPHNGKGKSRRNKNKLESLVAGSKKRKNVFRREEILAAYSKNCLSADEKRNKAQRSGTKEERADTVVVL
jgi:hypothetical protein